MEYTSSELPTSTHHEILIAEGRPSCNEFIGHLSITKIRASIFVPFSDQYKLPTIHQNSKIQTWYLLSNKLHFLVIIIIVYSYVCVIICYFHIRSKLVYLNIAQNRHAAIMVSKFRLLVRRLPLNSLWSIGPSELLGKPLDPFWVALGKPVWSILSGKIKQTEHARQRHLHQHETRTKYKSEKDQAKYKNQETDLTMRRLTYRFVRLVEMQRYFQNTYLFYHPPRIIDCYTVVPYCWWFFYRNIFTNSISLILTSFHNWKYHFVMILQNL